jgi:hypothetical protein
MSDKHSLYYIMSKLYDGFMLADEERRLPTVVMEFVSLQGLAEKVGREALEELIGLMESGPQEGDEFPLITLQAGDRSLNVAVIGLDDVIGLEGGILPFFADLARFTAGLAQYIVLAGQSALVVFSEEMLKAPAEKALQKAIRFGAYLRPQSVEFVDKRRCILTWYDES